MAKSRASRSMATRNTQERNEEPKQKPTSVSRVSILQLKKDRFTVHEVAEELAVKLDCNVNAARARIYRGIDMGRIHCVRYLGSIRILRHEAERILKSEA